MGILARSIETAIECGADRIEIEYENGQEVITAFVNDVGLQIDSVESSKTPTLLRELAELKQAKKLKSAGRSYRLRFSEYDSFGETAYRIGISVDDRA